MGVVRRIARAILEVGSDEGPLHPQMRRCLWGALDNSWDVHVLSQLGFPSNATLW